MIPIEEQFIDVTEKRFHLVVLGALTLLLAHASRMELRYGEAEHAATLLDAAKQMHIIIDPVDTPDAD